MMDLFNLKGKKAFVTGRTGLLAPIWKETLESVGCQVMMYGLPDDDVTDKDKLLHTAMNFAPDIIINNAAIDNPPTSKATFFGNCKEILDVNLLGAVNVCESFIPGMIKKGGGVIVNIGSIMGARGAVKRNYELSFEKPVGYNVSKAALVQLSRSVTTQYGDKGIRSVTIGFGPYDGGKLEPSFLSKFLSDVPLKRTVSKQSLQTTLLFACCCPELAGQLVLVDGGFCA